MLPLLVPILFILSDAIQVGVIYNASLIMDTANETISASSCNECVCAMLNSTGNNAIVSVNCLINGSAAVSCELFSASVYLNSNFYQMENTSHGIFYFRQLPTIEQSETTPEIILTISDEPPTTTMEYKCTELRWNTTAIVLATPGNGTNQVQNPQAVFIPTGSDELYVSDKSNHRILKWQPGSVSATIVAGGQGPGRNATQLNQPTALYVDQGGTIFAADRMNSRVQVFTNGSLVGRTIYGNQTTRTPNNTYGAIFGLSVDLAGNVYVAESTLNRVLKIAPNSTNAALAASNSIAGVFPYQLNVPTGIYADPLTGTLYIANQNAHCIVKWIPGDFNGTVVAGICGTSGSNATLLNKPKGVTFDKYGNMYVADGATANTSRIIMFCCNSVVGIPIITSGLNSPQTVAFDSNFSMYVSDTSNSRVVKYNLL